MTGAGRCPSLGDVAPSEGACGTEGCVYHKMVWEYVKRVAEAILSWILGRAWEGAKTKIAEWRLPKISYVVLATLLRESSIAVHDPTSAPQALDNIVRAIADIVSRGDEKVRVGILVPTEDGSEFRLLAGIRYSSRGFQELRLPNDPSQSVAGEAWATRKIIIVPDVDQWPTFQRKPQSSRPYKSLMLVPITEPISGEPVALLTMDAIKGGYFGDADREAALAFIHVLSAVLRFAKAPTRLMGH